MNIYYNLKKLGNETFLNRNKTAILCSRQTPESECLTILNWTHQLSIERDCILCGNHSHMEQEVFTLLLELKIPTVLVLAETMREEWSKDIKMALQENRILILTNCEESIHQVNKQSATDRNRIMLSLASSVVVGYCAKGGNIEKEIAGRNNVKILVPPSSPQTSEQDLSNYRMSSRSGNLFFDIKEDNHEQYLKITQSKHLSTGNFRREKIFIDRSELFEFKEDIDKIIHYWQLEAEQKTTSEKKYTLEEVRLKHGNAYLPWEKEADEYLIRLFKEGKSINELAEIFERNQGGIRSRLKKLGMLE